MAAIRCEGCGRWLTPEEHDLPCTGCGSTARNDYSVAQAVADKMAVARVLATKHFQAEEGLQRIFRLAGSADLEAAPVEPIKLLEVNANAVPSGVLPVSFGPAPASGIPYSSVIVEVSPHEFAMIQTHQLALPGGWQLGEEFPRPSADVESH